MNNHKAGESKAERKFRRLVEHNKKMIAEHFHLNYDKHQKEHMKRLGEHFRGITAKFTDREMDEAMLLGEAIIDRIKPEDGYSYEEIATVLWGEECLEDGTYVSKVDRLLYVLQMIMFEFGFNTTIEPEEAKRRTLPIIPHVKSTKKIRVKGDDGKDSYKEFDKPFKMIFNAAASREYSSEAAEKLGNMRKLKKNDYARVGVPRPVSKEDKVFETILDNLKGVDNQDIVEYVQELGHLVERITDIVGNFGPDGTLEDDLINEVIPESRGKSDSDLEPYRLKFRDAMYMLYKSREIGESEALRNSKYKKAIAEFKREYGYLEGN